MDGQVQPLADQTHVDVVDLAMALLGVESLSNDEGPMADILEHQWFRPRGWHVRRQRVDKEGGKPDHEGHGPRYNIYAQRYLFNTICYQCRMCEHSDGMQRSIRSGHHLA